MLMIIAGAAGVYILVFICLGYRVYSKIKMNEDKVSKIIHLKETENEIVKKDATQRPRNPPSAPQNIALRDDKTNDSELMSQVPANLT